MIDREKVIEALKRCEGPNCTGCPYDGICATRDFALTRDAIALLNKQESEWLEDSDPGQEYGSTWACRKCMHSIHKPYIWNPYDSGYKYCIHCGAEMRR